MPENVEQSCGNCMFERNNACHRYPPKLYLVFEPRDGDTDPTTEETTRWPAVATYDSGAWCGEWAQPALSLSNGS